MGFIRWGGKKYYPQRPKPYKPDINELMKPLSEKVGKGNVWGSVIMNVEKDDAVPVSPTPTPSITPTMTVTPSLTPTITPSPACVCGLWQLFNNDSNSRTWQWVDCNTGAVLQHTFTQPLSSLNVCSRTTPIKVGGPAGGSATYQSDCSNQCPVASPTPTPTPSVTPTLTPTITTSPSPTPTLTPTSSPSAFDSDAALYLADVLSAGGSVDATMSAATDTLFTSLKSNGLYNEMFAFYPMLGGTSSSTAINGIRTSGTTYDINWLGSWTFNTSGATGNGSNTYATFNISGGTLPATNSHIALYGNLPNLITNTGYDLSINKEAQSGRVSQIIFNFNNTGNGFAEYSGYAAIAGGNSGDFLIFSRNAAGTETIRARNGVALSNKVEPCNDIDNSRQWFLGAEQNNSGNKGASSKNRYCWLGFGNKLTEAQLLTYQNIINTFQTTLGRNTYT